MARPTLSSSPDPWSDARLDAAFAALADAGAPPGLAAAIRDRLDADGASGSRRLRLPRLGRAGTVALVGALAVVVGVAAWSTIGGQLLGPGFTVSRGGDGSSTFDAGEFRFSFPAAWSVGDARTVFSGGSVIAVLGTSSMEPRCGIVHVDINCVYERRLDPGEVRVIVGTATYRGTTVLDRPDSETGITTRPTVGGMPAILDDQTATAGYYLADLNLLWSIGRPHSLGSVVRIEVLAREPGAADARAAAEALVASFAYTPPPATLPPDREDGIRVARLAIDQADADFRRGWGQAAGGNHYSCQPDDPDVPAAATITFSAGGDLGGEVPVTCSWTLEREGDLFWRVALRVDWSIAGAGGRYTETLWLDAAGAVVHVRQAGEGPPMVPATPAPTALPTGPARSVLGLDVITVEAAIARRDAGPSPEEIAVLGWVATAPVTLRCAYTDRTLFDLRPWCQESLTHLMRDPERLTADVIQPAGPSLNPLLREASLDVGHPTVGPVEVIVIGHFDDPRSGACPAGEEAECRLVFVAERVLAADTAAEDALTLPRPWTRDGSAAPSATSPIEHLRYVPNLMPLSVGRVPASSLAAVEPAAAAIEADVGDVDVWIVRALPATEGGVLVGPWTIRTYVVPDPWIAQGEQRAYEVVDGRLEVIAWIID
ncbi:MAG: hypothetical protein A2V85_03575 [Chloroflexi bacterium RBG_16_72_14]|nr:MAG: hypothetical protein A2V85_03575 [Chloroflexi bacterium RBG_16_72_14]